MINQMMPAPEEFRGLPKVDLHRHLEGSLRLSTMLDVARKHGMTIPANVVRLSRLVQVQDEDNLTFDNFLSKFNTLRMFYRSPEVIERITLEAVEDAAKTIFVILNCVLRRWPSAAPNVSRSKMWSIGSSRLPKTPRKNTK